MKRILLCRFSDHFYQLIAQPTPLLRVPTLLSLPHPESLLQVCSIGSTLDHHQKLSTKSQQITQPIHTKRQFFDFSILHNEQELTSIVEKLGAQLTGRQIAAAFYRLREFQKAPENTTLQTLSNYGVQFAYQMSATDIIQLVSACVRLRYRNEVLLEALLSRLMQREVQLQLSPPHIASALIGIGLLQEDSPIGARFRQGSATAENLQVLRLDFLQEMVRFVVADGFLENLKTSDFVHVMSGFGMFRFHSRHLKDAILTELSKESRQSFMKFQELAYTWKALAQLQIQDSALLNLVSEEIGKEERMQGFKPRELEILLSATKLMPRYPRRFLHTLVSEISKPDRISSFTGSQLASIIQTLSIFQYQKSSVLEILLAEVTDPNRLRIFTRMELSSIACSFKKLKLGSHENMKTLMSKIEGFFFDSGLTDDQILSFVLGPRKSKEETEACNQFLDQLLIPERISRLSDIALSGLLSGMHERNVQDPEKLAVCIEEILTRLKLASPQVLSYYAYGLRVNNIQDPAILQAFVDEVLKNEKLVQFEASQLAGIVYSLGMLRWKDKSTFQTLFHELSREGGLSEVSEQGLANVITILQFSQIPLSDPLIEMLLSEVVKSYRLLKYSERSLVSMISNFGRLRIQKRQWTLLLFEEVVKLGRLARLTNQELADVVYNVAQMRIKSTKGIENLKNEILKPSRLRKLRKSELALMIYGLGANHIVDAELKEAIAHHLALLSDLASFKNPEITNLIQGLAGLQCQHHECVMNIFAEAMKEDRLVGMKPAELATLIYGAYQLEVSNPRFLRIFTEQLERGDRFRMLSNQKLTHVVIALLGMKTPSEDILPSYLLDELSKSDRLEKFESYQLVELAIFLAERGELDEEEGKLMKILAEEIQRSERIRTMTKRELNSISCSLSEAGCKDHSIFKQISDELVDRFLKMEDQGINPVP